MKYDIKNDIESLLEIYNYSQNELANKIGVEPITINRILSGEFYPSDDSIKLIYDFAYNNKTRFNEIKSMFYKEEEKKNTIILFHGSKKGIEGEINLNCSRNNNDFGKGFYLGESMKQSASFVSKYPNSSIYIFELNNKNLKSIKYEVNRNWILTIAYFRDTLNKYSESNLIKKLISKLDDVDYIYAPIADNRMFKIIDTFIAGEITDEQCKHCLAATNLGYQYVIKSDKAIKNLKMLENCYLTDKEREEYIKQKDEIETLGDSKVKLARIEYRGKGKYIDEIIK